MELNGYGATAAFDGETLHLRSRTALAFGAKERHLPVTSIVAVSFKDANILTNGNVTVQVGEHRYQVHFLKRAQPDAVSLYRALLAASGADPHVAPAGSMPPVERLQTVSSRVDASVAGQRDEGAGRESSERASLHPDTDAASRAQMSGASQLTDTGSGDRTDAGVPITTRSEAKEGAAAARVEAKEAAAAARAEAKSLAVASRATAKAARAQMKDDAKTAKAAAAAAEEDVIHAFSVGALPAYIDEHGLPEPLAGWEVVDRLLATAAEHAAAKEVESEERAIRDALAAAKNNGGRRMRKVTEQRITATTGRTLRIRSSYIGRVEAEDGFSQHARKGKLFAIVTAEKWVEIRSDRVIGPSSAHAIDVNTSAQVYLDGQALVTQRPTLTRMALLSPLPGSTIIPGMALQKKEKTDTRQGEFQVGGLGWSLRVMVHPDRMSAPRQLAEQVNRYANDLASTAKPTINGTAAPEALTATVQEDDILTRLERLHTLVASGALTQDEADVLKRSILEG